jgi:hypothetical protein
MLSTIFGYFRGISATTEDAPNIPPHTLSEKVDMISTLLRDPSIIDHVNMASWSYSIADLSNRVNRLVA